MIQEIIGAHLVTGENVIGKKKQTLDGTFIIEDPRVIQIVPTREGPSVMFVPLNYPIGSDNIDTLEIDRNKILWKYLNITKNMEDAYLTDVSGISISSSSNVVKP